ncbi:sporulation membrane protein YtaF [Radiobacillus kanasensis]|uniref:sporulation membrane protein YtaF n=1 Tax=Radiobacillus kanasensis TaxID=2844358 RepID=UPI001E29BA26|nr:sporulation membrane protein YtaF [Radiobacillus kanasensis]UFT98334.1 sporulation membrane protein YtaF [Radiobacillus kanasensis]
MIAISYLSLLILALAVSLDGFGVGLSYGLRKIKIPFISIFIITLCTGIVVLLSMTFGELITSFTGLHAEHHIGAWILIIVGVWATINYFKNDERSRKPSSPDKGKGQPTRVIRINLKSLGFVIEILKVPSKADLDNSGTIKGWEAVLLGTALSLDSFGAGIGASFMGFSPVLTALTVAFLSCLMIFSGTKIGLTFANVKWLNYVSFLPGIILIGIGISKLL